MITSLKRFAEGIDSEMAGFLDMFPPSDSETGSGGAPAGAADPVRPFLT
ncbi:hypothetical protein AB0K15_32580 [Amycolatopsis sp. NPDC049253]